MEKIKVFISYKQRRDEVIRTAIAGVLKTLSSQNIEVMFDEILIGTHKDIHDEIDNYIKSMGKNDWLIAVLSDPTVSPEIVREIANAKNAGVNRIMFADESIQLSSFPFDSDTEKKHVKYSPQRFDSSLNELLSVIDKTKSRVYMNQQDLWNRIESNPLTGLDIPGLLDNSFRSKLKPNYWALTFVGKNPHSQIEDFKDSLTGEVKEVPSGYAYWGIGPLEKWKTTTNDPQYRIMNKSIQSFDTFWVDFMPHEPDAPSKLDKVKAYISLGTGTGEKDKVIVKSLLHKNPTLVYIPVDMSIHMLGESLSELRRNERNIMSYKNILPIEMDFFKSGMLTELRKIIEKIIPDKEQILFSILGNTLANFEEDSSLLKRIQKELMDNNDLLLLEVAKTDRIDDWVKKNAESEYTCPSFKDFALSSLIHHTIGNIEVQNYGVETSVESEKGLNGARALKIECKYYNKNGYHEKLVLFDSTKIDFNNDEAIRVYLSRKYTSAGVNSLLEKANLKLLQDNLIPYSERDPIQTSGSSLLLTERKIKNH
jgi:L-histidine Nalpha-methyltransferase